LAVYDGYEAVIGLEVHAQLQTASKIFCACRVEYGEPPNVLTCPTCLGLPGALPVLNKKAVDYALRLIMAVGGAVNKRSVFARKNYFYPDLPKGYQISQYERPLGQGGAVEFDLPGGGRGRCGINRVHLEEDAGKSLHPDGGEKYTRIDLNRCGAALVEIVTEPEIASPEEAYGYLQSLKLILQYLRICSGDMEKGHLRCDANVSVRPAGQTAFGTRTEVKNMNSFKAVQRALRFEIQRQIRLLRSGGKVSQATLLWDEKQEVAVEMRGKEESEDYRYFPEPDLVSLNVTDDWINHIRDRLPELPDARTRRLVRQYQIRDYDASVLCADCGLADYFEQVMKTYDDAQVAANWIQTEVLALIGETGVRIGDFCVRPAMLAELLGMVSSGEISGRIGKTVLAEMHRTGRTASAIIKDKGLALISDPARLSQVIDDVLRTHTDSVAAYRGGKLELFGFFVGQVMKATRGQADPVVVNDLLKQKLET